MASHAVDFPALSWKDEGPGIRTLETHAVDSRWAIVEYGPGSSRDEWCTDGHRGYVIEGAIEYEFEDGSGPLAFHTGQGFVLAAGSGHRGRNPTDAATRLFLIDDPS
jgi:cupin domain